VSAEGLDARANPYESNSPVNSHTDATTDRYPFVLRDAAEAFLAHGLEAGRAALSSIAGEIWRSTAQRPAMPLRRNAQANSTVGKRSFSPARSAATFIRDAFRCRYCGAEIIPRPVAVLLSDLYPSELPYTIHYRSGCMHPLYWTRVAEADHLIAGSVGGVWADPDNHVTSCVVCNTRKGKCSIEKIGWKLLNPVGGWDGLTSLYPIIWERAERPRTRYHRPWLRSFAKLF
jgi:5-methylcytosine-specific restriction endonuclease McrA